MAEKHSRTVSQPSLSFASRPPRDHSPQRPNQGVKLPPATPASPSPAAVGRVAPAEPSTQAWRRRLTLSDGADGVAQDSSPAPLNLLKLAAGVVQSRTGSVLSRGFIIKSDSRPVAPPSSSETEGLAFAPGAPNAAGGSSTRSASSDRRGGSGVTDGVTDVGGGTLHLTGATNFRQAELDVYGVAQPTETGLRTVLSMLRSQESPGPRGERRKGRETVWFCTREEPVVYLGSQPFVLREAAHPTRTYSISDRAENLEGIEKR